MRLLMCKEFQYYLCLVLNHQIIKCGSFEVPDVYENERWNKLFVVQNDSHCSWIRPYSLCYGLTVWVWTWRLKGTVSRDFLLLVFFMNQFPPSLWLYHQGRFEFFRKFAEIFAAQGLPPVSTTPVANGKNLQSEQFLLILFGHYWVVEETYI